MAGVSRAAWERSARELVVDGIMQVKPDGGTCGPWRSTGLGFAPCLDCWTRYGHLVPVGFHGDCTHGGKS